MSVLSSTEIFDLCAGIEPAAVRALGTDMSTWHGVDVTPEHYLVRLGDAGRDEIRRLLACATDSADVGAALSPQRCEVPHLAAAMTCVRENLKRGVGVAVLDRLPLDELDPDDTRRLLLALARWVARPVAQKWDGTLLYDVADTGQVFGHGVRGSYTNVELGFHTDNAFGRAPPEYVGLLCLRPAFAGGESRFCSVAAVHDRMLTSSPELLSRLYRPMLWDRQAEHAAGDRPVARAPMFLRHHGAMRVRVNPSLVRKGYELAGQLMDDELTKALATFQRVTDDPRMWFEAPIERGQIQYLNNTHVVHYRARFQDDTDPHPRRHLIRTWHRDEFAAGYDG